MIDIFRDIKNTAISEVAKNFINNKVREYGEMVNLKIDSKNKNISLEILLKGEENSIIIDIEKYKIISKDSSHFIQFQTISVSRKWIEVLINNIIIPNSAPNHMKEIEPTYAKILDLLL